jgi:hypothetical protein
VIDARPGWRRSAADLYFGKLLAIAYGAYGGTHSWLICAGAQAFCG